MFYFTFFPPSELMAKLEKHNAMTDQPPSDEDN